MSTPAEPLAITVALIVRNESDRLHACLEPLQGRFSQVIAYVNDTQDSSVSILKSYGAEVVEGPWLGFSGTRKALWQMASNPWILWLDADEVLPSRLIDSLASVGSKPSIGGYRLCRQIIFQNQRIRFGEWGRDWVLRLFPADNWTMDDVQVHESVTLKAGAVASLPGIVDHHSFRSWDDLERRSARYIDLWVTDALAKAKRPAAMPGLRASLRFLRAYILKGGILDGLLGLRIALHNAREVYAKHCKLKARASSQTQK